MRRNKGKEITISAIINLISWSALIFVIVFFAISPIFLEQRQKANANNYGIVRIESATGETFEYYGHFKTINDGTNGKQKEYILYTE